MDARLNSFQKAVAQGVGFRHFHDMISSRPGEATWDGRACADYLASNGFRSKEDALQAIEWLEDVSGSLLLERDLASDGRCALFDDAL